MKISTGIKQQLSTFAIIVALLFVFGTPASAATAPAVAPSVTSQPASQTVTAGNTATFSVAASGTAPMSYQWSRNGAAIGGATSSSYTTAATTSSDNNAQFAVVATNSAGSATSTAAVLTVNMPSVAGSISIDFVGTGTAMGQQETAGVIAKSFWNNANGASNTSGLALIDETGRFTTANVTWRSDNVWALPITDQPGNVRMMTGYLDTGSGNPTTVTVSGLSAGTYDIYVYAEASNVTAIKTATYQISGSGSATSSTTWTDPPNNFSGTFTQAANSSGNYVKFSGLTATSFTVTATPVSASDGILRAAVNGIQIIPTRAAPPTYTSQPVSQTVTAGITATFSVAATGTVPMSYQWSRNGAAIGGATSSSYTTAATTSSDNNAQFAVVVTNSAGSATSTAAVLTVNTPAVAPSVTSQPASQAVTAGNTATFSVAASGTVPMSYQWSRNGAAIGGATSSSYTTATTTSSDNNAQFAVVVTNSAGSATSTAAVLTVNMPSVAGSISIDFVGTGTAMGQQETAGVIAKSFWNNANGASNTSGLALIDETGRFTTANVTWRSDNVWALPITDQPGNVRMMTGYLDTGSGNPTTVTVSGLSAGTYDIYVYAEASNVTAIKTATYQISGSGSATSSTTWTDPPNNFSGTFTQAANSSGNYVKFSGLTATSFTVTATPVSASDGILRAAVNGIQIIPTRAAPPTYTSQPASQTVIAGKTATFSVAASGTAPMSYQWSRNGAAIGGATSSSYTTAATTGSDNNAQFTVVITNSAGSATSAAAVLTVNPATFAPSVTSQPVSQTVTAGITATFSVAATGTVPMSYQWSRNGAAIGGATSSSYTTAATTSSDNNAQFAVVATNSAGSATSAAAVLTVNTPAVAPSVTSQPASQAVTAGNTATFSVAASGTAPMSYQWSRNGAAIGGATSSSYTTAATTSSDNNAQFAVVATNSAGSATSTAAVLTVNMPSVAGSISIDFVGTGTAMGQQETAGVIAKSFWNNANGASNTSGLALIDETGRSTTANVRWTSDNVWALPITDQPGNVRMMTGYLDTGSGNPTRVTVSGLSAGTYDIYVYAEASNVTAIKTATYQISGSGSATSSTTWTDPPNNFSGTFTQAANSSGNYVKFSGLTATGFTVTATPVSASDGILRAAVNGIQIIPTRAAPPTYTSQPASQTVIAGKTATFSVAASGTAPMSYQWSRNGAAIGGATSSSYTTAATTSSDNNAQFTVVITNSAGSATSAAATLTVTASSLILNSSATSVSFGSVNVSSTGTQTVTLTNAGNANITVSGVTISGPGFSTSGVSGGLILTPGQTATLTATFTPSASGNVTGTVVIASNAMNSPDSIGLSGTGVAVVNHSVALGWTASTSSVIGYNTYSSATSGGPYTKLTGTPLTATSYTDSSVQAGRTYYYVVTSVAAGNVESAYSGEVSAIVP